MSDNRRWRLREPVLHRITKAGGEVLAIDFEEGVAAVEYGRGDVRWARLENLLRVADAVSSSEVSS